MAWNTHRRDRLPPNWQRTIRPRILKRDPICRKPGCNAPSTDVDHILRGDDHRDENLQGLCHPHHLEKTHREARAAQAAMPKLARPREPHPGLR